MTLVKICGLTRRADAELAATAGARYGGVILAPGGKRTISAEQAAALFDALPLQRVGVFVDAPLEELLRQAALAELHVVQLHGAETPSYLREVRARFGGRIWKAVRPRDAQEFADALRDFAPLVDGLLVDGWSAHAAGGTGSSFPWEIVEAQRDRVPAGVELVVAGGLRPDNVGAAVQRLRPAVVDVSSGVERAPGIKDPEAVPSFVAAVRAAGRDLC